MRILCWNVNSIRTLRSSLRTQYPRVPGNDDPNELHRFFVAMKADVIAFQETKLTDYSQLASERELVQVPGYESFWTFSRSKKGYSGVCIYVRSGSAVDAWDTFEIDVPKERRRFADEGRCVTVDLGSDVLLMAHYFPNGQASEERVAYKLDYYNALQETCRRLRAEGKNIVVCGDVNTAHREIDIFDAAKFANGTGFLPEERQWITEFLEDGFVDAYRSFYPTKEKAYTFWDLRTQKRETNQGWRIDIFYVSAPLMGKVTASDIHAEVKGSDHCPVTLDLDLPVQSGLKPPALAASLRPEFSSKQQSISSFFKPKAPKDDSNDAASKRKADDKAEASGSQKKQKHADSQ
ncbi:exodeoxyribonuclease III [Hyaloraphidium curvatum]|nr:exodeoxyribonuclease III [Hyaloraphidium curvatum]